MPRLQIPNVVKANLQFYTSERYEHMDRKLRDWAYFDKVQEELEIAELRARIEAAGSIGVDMDLLDK